MVDEQPSAALTALRPHRPHSLALLLGAVITASIVGTIASVVPSMGFRSKSGILRYEYGLSRFIAPALFLAITIVAARALRPSRRRLRVAAGAILGASPFLFGIRLARLPFFDIDDQYVAVAPWALWTFMVCDVALLAAGVALLIRARRFPPDGEPLAKAHASLRS